MHGIRCGRRGLLVMTAGLLAAGSLPAQAQAPAPDDRAIIKPIQQLADGLVEIMKAGSSTPFQQRFAILAPIIDRSFDLAAILRESVGPTWSDLPADQQSMLMAAFRRYTVASYVNSFDSYDGQRFEVQPTTRAVGGNERVVMTKIIPRSGNGNELDYVMRRDADGWQAVDVLEDGTISRVAVQRSDFRQLLTRGGALALAASLRTKSAHLEGGSS